MEPPTSHVTNAFSDSDSASVEEGDADADADVEALRRLSDNLAAAFRSPEDFAFLADARIAVPGGGGGGGDLRVHRCVLSARSPFLRGVFARRAAAAAGGGGEDGSERLELRELLGGGGEEVEVGYEALRLVLDYLYSGRVGDLPKAACLCVDEDCAHVGCHPAVAFMAQVLFAASTFQVAELTNLFQRRLLDVLDKVEVDNLLLILSVANLCNKSCMKLLERCLDMVVRSNLDMITLEKSLPPDVIKQIIDARLSLGLISPENKGFPNKHVRRIHRALDSDDVELVRMLLTEGQTNLDDAFALHYAVEHCDSKITTELLDLALADVNHRNPRGYTVLHIAARRREPKIIVSLLTKGARPADVTFDGRKAVQISKRLTKQGDYFGVTEEGKPSPKDRLCIEILEQAERRDPQLGEASVSLAMAGESLRGRLLYLENRVALARIMFPMEARVAMDIAQVDGTLEFNLGSGANPPPERQRTTVDLNESPFIMKEEHLARMTALSKTVELGKRFFPRCSNVLDKIMDDETDPVSLGRDTSAEKRKRFHDLQDVLQKAFHEDKEENDRSGLSSSSSSTSIGAIRPRR
uniref:BTB/POZ domain and ankyrin repeat-containing protein NPR1 n=3 Tax=Oryza TaxID=4527 RepID=NPR1_ORYSI|nr:RecName: Full=BTB/POZ domain and ankyrin repeat-containing protein NPR1; Short=OsNPR1; AltName: Full=NPR1 homolog 1; Short=OsNH1 [Oryza sativa Indica Group]AAX18700.1 NPR1-like 1 [Oryza sativa Indica Group]ADE05560.1 ankyrin-repeat protein [Oryza sativa Indica Group]ADE05561.1 ankyrin-repeat protein [Oryza sativa Indica Group]